MSTFRIFGFSVLFVFLLLVNFSSLSSAATCAQKSYAASCEKCPFDKNGKMDQQCYEKYKASGQACLVAAYPIEAMYYQAGNCPAIDVCIDRLTTCKNIYSTGNDQIDCGASPPMNCFVKGDACIAKAVKNCSGTPPGDLTDDLPPASFCDSVLIFIALFAGLAFIRKKYCPLRSQLFLFFL